MIKPDVESMKLVEVAINLFAVHVKVNGVFGVIGIVSKDGSLLDWVPYSPETQKVARWGPDGPLGEL